MEIFQMSCRFPATELRSGHILRCFVLKRPRTTSFFLSCAAAGNSYKGTATSESESPNRMFILGMGYVGKFFAQDLKGRGWVVSGSCTSLAKMKKLEEIGVDVHLLDANEPELEVLSIVNHHTHLLVSIPPLVGIGDPMLQHEELLRTRLVGGNLRWLCYLSSTSVYGNCGGAWVDEDYPACPTDEKNKARLAAEEGWLNFGHDLGISTQIFRLGGIYGPGRSAVDTLLKEEPLSETQIMRVSRRYTSRVHIADICQALRASIHNPAQGRIVNIVDDDPASRLEVFSYAVDLVHRKWPGHLKRTVCSTTAQSPSFTESSSKGEKRVSNTRLKEELGVRLFHPNYKSGLKSIIEHMDDPCL